MPQNSFVGHSEWDQTGITKLMYRCRGWSVYFGEVVPIIDGKWGSPNWRPQLRINLRLFLLHLWQLSWLTDSDVIPLANQWPATQHVLKLQQVNYEKPLMENSENQWCQRWLTLKRTDSCLRMGWPFHTDETPTVNRADALWKFCSFFGLNHHSFKYLPFSRPPLFFHSVISSSHAFKWADNGHTFLTARLFLVIFSDCWDNERLFSFFFVFLALWKLWLAIHYHYKLKSTDVSSRKKRGNKVLL